MSCQIFDIHFKNQPKEMVVRTFGSCNGTLSVRFCNVLIHNVLQNGPFRVAKRPESQREMGRIAMRNGPFGKSVYLARMTVTANCQTHLTNVYYSFIRAKALIPSSSTGTDFPPFTIIVSKKSHGLFQRQTFGMFFFRCKYIRISY